MRSNMAKELITEEEPRSQLRRQGVKDFAAVEAAYVEPDGRISVVQNDGDHNGGAPEHRGS